jgi:hypothetical protein
VADVRIINNITRNLLREEGQFNLGAWLDCEPDSQQLMIDALDALRAYLVHLRDTGSGGSMGGTDSLDALVLANAIYTAVAVVPRVTG